MGIFTCDSTAAWDDASRREWFALIQFHARALVRELVPLAGALLAPIPRA
jgi:hypothetical protein